MSRLPRTRTTHARPRSGRPDPVELAGLLTRVWLEVSVGRRPLSQLEPLVAPALLRQLRVQLARRTLQPATARIRILTTRDCRPAKAVREVSVVVAIDDRVSALAIRLERHQGAWRAVELTAPEAGLAPLRTASRPDPYRPRDAFDEVLEGTEELAS